MPINYLVMKTSSAALQILPGADVAIGFDWGPEIRRCRAGTIVTKHEVCRRTWSAKGGKPAECPHQRTARGPGTWYEDPPYRHRRLAPGAGSVKERTSAAYGVCAQWQRSHAGAADAGRCRGADRSRGSL